MAEFKTPSHLEWPHERSKWLFEQWLSPSQLQQFKRSEGFNVVGSRGGKYVVYSSGTLKQLKRRWLLFWLPRKVAKYCVYVENVPSFDNLLGLKVALEADERAVLKVAKRSFG